MTDGQYPVLSSTSVFRGRVLGLRTDEVRMSDGAVAVREVVEHPGAVGIVALDDADRVVLVNQYRHPVGRYLDELPAGLLDVAHEAPLAAAHRELYEEAALTAREWHVLVDLFTSPGMSDEAIRIYLARDLRPVPDADRFVAEHEELTLTVHRVPLDEAVQRVFAGTLVNASAVAGVVATWAARRQNWSSLRPADAPWTARAAAPTSEQPH